MKSIPTFVLIIVFVRFYSILTHNKSYTIFFSESLTKVFFAKALLCKQYPSFNHFTCVTETPISYFGKKLSYFLIDLLVDLLCFSTSDACKNI